MDFLGLSAFFPLGLAVWLHHNLGDDSRSDGLASFADSESHLLFKRDRGDELYFELDGVARHDHFGLLRKRNLSGHVSGANVELGLVACEDRGMAASFLL